MRTAQLRLGVALFMTMALVGAACRSPSSPSTGTTPITNPPASANTPMPVAEFTPLPPPPNGVGTPLPLNIPAPQAAQGVATGQGAAPADIAAQSGAAAPPSGGYGGGGTSLGGGGSSLRSDVTSVEGALRDLGAKTIGNEIVVDLPSDVLFDFDKHNIRPDAADALGKLLTIINAQGASAPIRIEGHTDSIANDAYNQRLSERRAASVKAWLAGRGVDGARVGTRGLGESRPRAPNAKPDGSDDPEGRQQNRRVEIFITRG